MADLPRRLRPNAAQRQQTSNAAHGALSASGSVRAARPVADRPTAGRRYSPPATGGSNVVTGVADDGGVAIESTTAGAGSVTAAGSVAIAIGNDAQADGGSSIAVGVSTTANATGSVAIGASAHSNGTHDCIAIGDGCFAGQANQSRPGASATKYDDCIAIGNGVRALGNNTIAMGDGAYAHGEDAISLGNGSEASGIEGIAIGTNTIASGSGSVAIGCSESYDGALASGENTVALGAGSVASSDGDIALGSAAAHVKVIGDLIIADGSGGLWRIAVSTGGALSAVAYP